jgi:hypothetical protein
MRTTSWNAGANCAVRSRGLLRPTPCGALTSHASAQRAGRAFAIIDHGSRRLLRFAALSRNFTFTLLGHLCLTIADFGLARAIRSDNESMFTG